MESEDMSSDILKPVFEQFGVWSIPVITTFVFWSFILAFLNTEEGSDFTILWGLLRLKKPTGIKKISWLTMNIGGYLCLMAAFVAVYFYAVTVPEKQCTYFVSSDEGTIRRIIEAEAEAVNKGDMKIIAELYATDATILDAGSGKMWNDPKAFYENNFHRFIFSDAINYSINRIGMDKQIATFTSASKGYYTNKATHVTLEYSNPPGTSEWILIRNSGCGCWRISKFTFNIKH